MTPAKSLDGTNFQLTRTVRRNFRWWHEAIVDDMLLHPTSTLAERATRLGYAPSYLSLLMNSDMFQAVYNERRANLKTIVDDSIAKKMADVADLGLSIMKEKLEKKRDSIPFKDLTELNLGLLDRLGYGAKSNSPSVQVNLNTQNNNTISSEALAEARAKLRAVENARAATPTRTVESLATTYLEVDTTEALVVSPEPEGSV